MRLCWKSGIKDKSDYHVIGWSSLYSTRLNCVIYSIFAVEVGPSNSLKSRFIYNGHRSESIQTPMWCIQIELCWSGRGRHVLVLRARVFTTCFSLSSHPSSYTPIRFWGFWNKKKFILLNFTQFDFWETIISVVILKVTKHFALSCEFWCQLCKEFQASLWQNTLLYSLLRYASSSQGNRRSLRTQLLRFDDRCTPMCHPTKLRVIR
jgi:hypothetical protein